MAQLVCEIEAGAFGRVAPGEEDKRLLAVPHGKCIHRRGCRWKAHDGDAARLGELNRVWNWSISQLPDRTRVAGCLLRRKSGQIREVGFWKVEVAAKPRQERGGVCPGCDCNAFLPLRCAAAGSKECGVHRWDLEFLGEEVAVGKAEC